MNKQTFLITGGANGIGRHLVLRLIGLKHHVIFIDNDSDQGLSLLDELQSEHAIFIDEDLSKEASLDRIKDHIRDLELSIDVIIHNACQAKGGIFNASYDDFIDVLKVGLVAPFYLTKVLLPYLAQNATIINIASTRAFQSQANTEAYSAAKGGLVALTHALSVSLKGRARSNSISPGWIDTLNNHPAPDQQDDLQHTSERRGTSEDILKAVLYLSDPENSFINGQNITIDGGMSKQMIYHNDEGWEKVK